MSGGVLIMARAPRPGAAKTRLEPLLGAEGCARLQAELVRHTAAWVAHSTRRTWLAFTPSDARDELAALIPRGVRLLPQHAGDLGQRLRAATEQVLRRHRGALAVIGADAPGLGPPHLREADHALAAGKDACVVPTLDGGYALIALARPTPAAFELPPAAWGGPDVLGLTLIALQAAGYTYALLEPVRDLDTPTDAARIAADPRCPPMIGRVLKGLTLA
jgi:rSAM/selenodomain-associated transferase 1